jgi:hypothetical protein
MHARWRTSQHLLTHARTHARTHANTQDNDAATRLTATGLSDGFVMKFKEDGSYRWSFHVVGVCTSSHVRMLLIKANKP